MEAPFWALLANWGPDALLTAIVSAVVWAILTGRLVPRSTLLDMRQDRDYWRTAHETSEGTRTIMARQNERLVTNSEVTIQVLTALRDEAKR